MDLEWKEQEGNSTVPRTAFYKVDKIHPNPQTQPLEKEEAASFTIVLNSMPSSFSNAHPERPAEGVSKRYLIKRKLFHFNTPQTVGALTVAPSQRFREQWMPDWVLLACSQSNRAGSILCGGVIRNFVLFWWMVKWTLCSSESKEESPWNNISLLPSKQAPLFLRESEKKIFTVHRLFTASLPRAWLVTLFQPET